MTVTGGGRVVSPGPAVQSVVERGLLGMELNINAVWGPMAWLVMYRMSLTCVWPRPVS